MTGKKNPIRLLTGDLPFEWYHAAEAAKVIGVDIETSGLDKQRDSIACVQIHVPDIGVVMLRNMVPNPLNLMMLLESPNVKKIFHHAPFDLAFLIRDYHIIPDSIADTMIAAKLLDPRKELFFDPTKNRPSHSLAALVWHYEEIVLDKTLATSNWFAKTLTKSQLDYAAKDVLYLTRILARIESALPENVLPLAQQSYRCAVTKVRLSVLGYESVYERN